MPARYLEQLFFIFRIVSFGFIANHCVMGHKLVLPNGYKTRMYIHTIDSCKLERRDEHTRARYGACVDACVLSATETCPRNLILARYKLLPK